MPKYSNDLIINEWAERTFKEKKIRPEMGNTLSNLINSRVNELRARADVRRLNAETDDLRAETKFRVATMEGGKK